MGTKDCTAARIAKTLAFRIWAISKPPSARAATMTTGPDDTRAIASEAPDQVHPVGAPASPAEGLELFSERWFAGFCALLLADRMKRLEASADQAISHV
jgi:hypothetical protein